MSMLPTYGRGGVSPVRLSANWRL